MVAKKPSTVTACLQARRRQWLNRFSLTVAENCRPLAKETWAHLPFCCAPVPAEDDPSQVAGVNFWDVEASGDADKDCALGRILAEDAVRYVREHPDSEILTGILYWMGAALHFEDRGPGPLEDGFVYRVLLDYPDAVHRMFAAVGPQCPSELN
jgi:hypothetical protein